MAPTAWPSAPVPASRVAVGATIGTDIDTNKGDPVDVDFVQALVPTILFDPIDLTGVELKSNRRWSASRPPLDTSFPVLFQSRSQEVVGDAGDEAEDEDDDSEVTVTVTMVTPTLMIRMIGQKI